MIQNDPFTRREFLRSGLIMASAAATIPAFLSSSANAMHAAMNGLSSVPGVPDDHILVVIQLSGGNDGLNTVVPFGMPEYYRLRPGIGIPEKDVLKLGGSVDHRCSQQATQRAAEALAARFGQGPIEGGIAALVVTARAP